MKYMIEDGDLYGKVTKPISIRIGDIIKVEALPFGCNQIFVGKVLAVSILSIKMDCSTEFTSLIRSFTFDNLIRIKVIKKVK